MQTNTPVKEPQSHPGDAHSDCLGSEDCRAPTTDQLPAMLQSWYAGAHLVDLWKCAGTWQRVWPYTWKKQRSCPWTGEI